MKRLLPVVALICTVLYPVILYLTHERGGARIVALFLAIVYLARTILLRDSSARLYQVGSVLLITFLLFSALAKNETLVLFVPALATFNVLLLFLYTLFVPPSFIEVIAMRMESSLNAKAREYCRRVTIVWCVFLSLNLAIALWTALYSSLETWTFYNGFLSYVLTAVLFASEYAYRQVYRRRYGASEI
ncbi:MAG: hypothetical protein U0136_12435 [Bdellovibrionota bacterium]